MRLKKLGSFLSLGFSSDTRNTFDFFLASIRLQNRTNHFLFFLQFGCFLHEITLFLHLSLSHFTSSLILSHKTIYQNLTATTTKYEKMAYLSPSTLIPSNENSSLDSIRTIVISINDYILSVISNPEAWISLKQKCITISSIEEDNTLFEFSSEHSALSNLYWGIESIEASIQPECSEEKISRLRNSERMLQMPALLDEQGTTTSGVPNTILIAFSYFYLSIVSYLQGDSLQTTSHFLQSVLVSPEIVRTDIAPQLCDTIFFTESDEEEIREIASKYKYRATYYQVMSYGEIHQPLSECNEQSFRRSKKYRYRFSLYVWFLRQRKKQ